MSKKNARWRKLDNAAKLYSAASNKKDTRVFRFYCELKEEVNPKALQEALNQTIETFPTFLMVLRKGLFWHYLEPCNLRPIVKEEYKEPCSRLYIRDKKTLLFEVTYYKKRINFEVFHVLTDGTGATEFLKELVKNYLYLVHKEEGLEQITLLPEDMTVQDQEDDSFLKYYSKNQKRPKKRKLNAFQIRRKKKDGNHLHVHESVVSVQAVLKRSRELGVSMTIFLTALFMMAINEEMSKMQKKKPVVLMVPVNLRKFFPSSSMLNFFNWIEPGYHFQGGKEEFTDVVQKVNACFKEELTAEKMEKRMNDYFALQVHPILKFAPLELKNVCINIGARTAESDVTAIFSNMGIIRMPESYETYIRYFGVYTSTPKVELCMCSFRDKIYLGFTSRYDCDAIKDNFFQILKEQEVKPEILEVEYPESVMTEAKGMQIFKIFTFLCMIAIVAALGVDYSIDTNFHLSLFVCGGAFSMWLALAVGFFKRYNLLKNAMWQLIIVTVGCIIWDWLTGWHGWSIDFVLPGVSGLIMISMLIISRVYYRQAKDYLVYFVMAALYGMILPFIFLLTGKVRIVFPSVISIGMGVLMLIGLVLFKGKEMRQEMEKNLHV